MERKKLTLSLIILVSSKEILKSNFLFLWRYHEPLLAACSSENARATLLLAWECSIGKEIVFQASSLPVMNFHFIVALEFKIFFYFFFVLVLFRFYLTSRNNSRYCSASTIKRDFC